MFVNDAESTCDISGSLYKKWPSRVRVLSMSALDAVEDMDVLMTDYSGHDEACNGAASLFVESIYGPSREVEQSLGFKHDHCPEFGRFFRRWGVVVDLRDKVALAIYLENSPFATLSKLAPWR